MGAGGGVGELAVVLVGRQPRAPQAEPCELTAGPAVAAREVLPGAQCGLDLAQQLGGPVGVVRQGLVLELQEVSPQRELQVGRRAEQAS